MTVMMNRIETEQEWSAAKMLRNKNFFDKIPMDDPYTWTFNHPDHVHFVLYQGTEIIGYAHIQLWPENRLPLGLLLLMRVNVIRALGHNLWG